VSAEFTHRLRASGLSLWELGDLLGIHPHQVHHADTGLSIERPIAVLIELSRRLSMHPADLVADLEGVLANRRAPASPDDDHAGEDHDTGPSDCQADALTLLTALAHARDPLSIDALAQALRWPLTRTQAALTHARQHPSIGGPLALQRVPPQTFTVTPRLDILTQHQHRSLQSTAGYSRTLTQNEAIVLLAALAYGHCSDYATFRDSDHYRHAETALKRAGTLYSVNGPHRVDVSDDVLYSLRYRDDTHIARERGEHTTPAAL